MTKNVMLLACSVAGILLFSTSKLLGAEVRVDVPFEGNIISIPTDVKYIAIKNRVTMKSSLAFFIPADRFRINLATTDPARPSSKKDYEFVSLTASTPPGFDIEGLKQRIAGETPQVWQDYDLYKMGVVNLLYISRTNKKPHYFSCANITPMPCQALTSATIFLNTTPARLILVNIVYDFSSRDINIIDKIDDEIGRILTIITKKPE